MGRMPICDTYTEPDFEDGTGFKRLNKYALFAWRFKCALFVQHVTLSERAYFGNGQSEDDPQETV